jgi:putative transposase
MRIAARSGPEVAKAQLGSKRAKQVWEPRPGQLKVQRPLELIQIDHTPVDVQVLTDDRKTVLGRPWLTVAIDVGTRCVLGIYLSMDAPSSVSVSLCIENACLPKEEGDMWPMYGLPERILVDNGKDFRAMALQRGCEEHGIQLEWRPVRTPHYGAHIERLIGTLMKIAHLVPGTTFSNVKERADYESEERARFTLEELRLWLVQKICRYYHVRRHRSLGVSPLLAWEEGHTDAEGRIQPPAVIPYPTEFRMSFLPYVTRLVRRTGIELGNSRYWDDGLRPLLNQKEGVIVRYDPRRRESVWVRRSDGVLVIAGAIAGVAANDLSALRRMDNETKARMSSEMDKGFAACDAIEAQAQRETQAARRRQGRAAAQQKQVETDANEAVAPTMTSIPPNARPVQTIALSVEEWI